MRTALDGLEGEGIILPTFRFSVLRTTIHRCPSRAVRLVQGCPVAVSGLPRTKMNETETETGSVGRSLG